VWLKADGLSGQLAWEPMTAGCHTVHTEDITNATIPNM
jgi:hypothetical protein